MRGANKLRADKMADADTDKTLFQLLCGIDTQGSQELIQPFHLEYMILNRTIASA